MTERVRVYATKLKKEIRQEERQRIREVVEGIIDLQVGGWNKDFVEKIGVEKVMLQDAANEGWNNCKKLLLEILTKTSDE